MKLLEFQKYLDKEKIDLTFFIHPDPNITYFTSTKPSHAFLLIHPRSASLYLTKLDHKPNLKKISTYFLTKGWEKKFTNNKIKKIGLNKETMTLAYYDKLKKLYPKAKFVDISIKLKELRSQKTNEEIKKITKACQITVNTFNAVVNELQNKLLKTEQDVADFIEKSFRKQGGGIAFPTIVAMGKNAAIPHHQTNNHNLKRGFLLMDFGASFKNYNADMTRVVFLGKPTKAEKNYYNILLNSQQGVINKVAKNLLFKQLDDYVRKSLGKYSNNFIHSLGHGIGIEVHESPVFSNIKHKIQQNHVFTIEPGIYFSKKFGLRIEDTLVFNGKAKVLTTASKELIYIKRP